MSHPVNLNLKLEVVSTNDKLELEYSVVTQESCAIAKMTAQCALHMGALEIFGTL